MPTGFPSLNCTSNSKKYKSIAWPQSLTPICDTATIKQIGIDYRKKFPEETQTDHLAQLILTDKNGKILSDLTDTNSFALMLRDKISQDFRSGETIIIKGWVLSKTEGRQCALFSHLN